MIYKHRITALALGLFLAAGVSSEALSDPRHGSKAYRGHHHAVTTQHFRHAKKYKRHARRFHRDGYLHRRAAHAYPAPGRYIAHYPQHFQYARHSRYDRYHRYQRFHRHHRRVDLGAVIAGAVAGGLVYELLRADDYDYRH